MNRDKTIVMNDALIVKYLSGEAAPEEAQALTDWIRQPDNRIHYERLASTWNATHPKKPGRVSKEDAWKKLTNEVIEIRKQRYPGFFKQKWMALGIAASLLLVTGGSVFYISFRGNDADNMSIKTSNSSRQVVFSDSSKAVLYHNTSISFPGQFHGDLREIKLQQGEAFFKIAHNVEKPFIIHTPVADITVIGTSFNVVVNRQQLKVDVSEGRVMINNYRDSAFLDAGAVAIVDSEHKNIAIDNSTDTNAWGYATRRFVFKDTPLNQIIESLEKAYPCTIQVAHKSIENCKMTASFNNNSAENIVNLIAESLNLSVTRNGTSFILDGQGCP